jgi:hypothetical protein
LPDALVEAAVTMASGDAFPRELDDLVLRLRNAAQEANRRGVYGLADVLYRAATSAESWGWELGDSSSADD